MATHKIRPKVKKFKKLFIDFTPNKKFMKTRLKNPKTGNTKMC